LFGFKIQTRQTDTACYSPIQSKKSTGISSFIPDFFLILICHVAANQNFPVMTGVGSLNL
jgi:hypothetical protein